MTKYTKFIVQILAAILAALVVALGDGAISGQEWVNVAILGVGAAGVFAAPNVPYAKYTKTVLAVLAAVLVVLNSAIVGGVSTEEWLQIAVAALGAVGVYSVKNGTNSNDAALG